MAEYPRLLNLDVDTQDRLRSWLDTELRQHIEERQDYTADLERWQKDYWVKPSKTVRKFPFYGASNIIIPLTAISVEAVHARMMTTMFGVSPVVNAQMFADQFPLGTDSAWERYIDFELEKAGFYNTASDMLMEAEKFGTLVGKSGYEKIVRKAVRDVGGQEEEFSVITRQTATIDPVANARFYMPFNSTDPQDAPWVGELHSWTPYQIKLAEESGLFDRGTYEKLLDFAIRSNDEHRTGSGQGFTRDQQELENRKPIWPNRLDFYELWCAFDVDGDDEEEEIQIFYHQDSNLLMGVRYNWYDDLHRPYRNSQYIPVEHRWAGIGICKQNDQFQREITTIHRQRLDNATVANMRMFKVHKLSGYGPNEPIFPGKMWFVDDMTHIDSVQAGEVYQSSFANEQAALLFSQQRTGVNEVMLGMPQMGTPGTATGDLARIQEGNKKFDFSLGHLKKGINQLIVDFACNLAQFGTRNIEYIQTVPNGELIQAVLAQPVEAVRRGVIYRLELAGAQKNRLTDRNNWREAFGMFTQYYGSMLQMAQLTQNPELISFFVKKAMIAGVEIMRQLGETYEMRKLDKLLPVELERMLMNAGGNGSNQPAQPRSTGGNPTINPQQGLDLAALLGGGA